VVQADGTYDADPDLATLTFQIFAQDKTSSVVPMRPHDLSSASSRSHSGMDWLKMNSEAGADCLADL